MQAIVNELLILVLNNNDYSTLFVPCNDGHRKGLKTGLTSPGKLSIFNLHLPLP